MSRRACLSGRQSGLGLVELLVAMVLGVVLVLGVVQLFVASKQSFEVQRLSAGVQEDARFILNRLTRELRMVGMYGCLDLTRLPDAQRAWVPAQFATPIRFDGEVLSLITADPTGELFASPSVRSPQDYNARWLIASNCRDGNDFRLVEDASLDIQPGDMVIPVRLQEYRLRNYQVQSRLNGSGNFETLLGGVVSLEFSFGLAASAEDSAVSGQYVSTLASTDLARIRSVRLALRLSDNPQAPDAGRVRAQDYRMVVAIRNLVL